MATKKQKPKLIEAEDDAYLATLRTKGVSVKQVTFVGERYWFYLSARGLRIAGEQGIKVLDQVSEAITQASSMGRLHSLMMQAMERRAQTDEQIRKGLEGASAEEIADALSDMLYQTAQESLGQMSLDRLIISMSAAFWAGIVPFYPSMTLADVDGLMGFDEVERVQDQIQDDLLQVLNSTRHAAERRKKHTTNGLIDEPEDIAEVDGAEGN